MYAICHVHGCCIGQARIEVDAELLDAIQAHFQTPTISEALTKALSEAMSGSRSDTQEAPTSASGSDHSPPPSPHNLGASNS